MADYDYRPVRQSTANRLTEIHKRLSSFSSCEYNPAWELDLQLKDGTFHWDGQKWTRRVSKPKPEPGPRYSLIYGEQFPGKGGIFGLIRLPGTGNWYKTYLPALGRLLRRKGFSSKFRDYQLEGDDGTIFNAGNWPTFVFNGKEFADYPTTKKETKHEPDK